MPRGRIADPVNTARRRPVLNHLYNIYRTMPNASRDERTVTHTTLINLLGMDEAAVKTSVRYNGRYRNDMNMIRKELLLHYGITLSNDFNTGYVVNMPRENIREVRRMVDKTYNVAGNANMVATRTPAQAFAISELEAKYSLPRRRTQELRDAAGSVKVELATV